MEILKVDKLCKTYGTGDARVEALKAVSLTLEKGEFAAVVGESGSGKSTLLNLVGGLDTPNAGKVADEPTGNLDSKTSREVIALLHGMSRKYRQSVLMITHNMNIAADADRVFRVTDGCLEEVNSGREAFDE